MIKVRLFFSPKYIVGKDEISVSAKNLKRLLNKLVKDYPKLKEVLFVRKGKQKELNDHIIIMIDGLSARNLDAPLKDGATVMIFSAISGG